MTLQARPVRDSPSSVTPPSHGSVASILADRSLHMHFQPIVRLGDGTLFGHEALVRGPENTVLQWPDTLFAQAQEQGLSLALEEACLRTAVTSWTPLRAPGKLFINLSAEALMHILRCESLQRRITALRRFGLSPSAVVIELTEHERVRDLPALIDAVRPLRAHGVQLALDDFGDGRSSLRLWSELQPDYVKIDKYFARDVAHQADKVQTMRALVRIAETMGTTMVAEGIETADDLKAVRDLGIQLGQGYFLGRPQPEPAQKILAQAGDVFRQGDVAVLPHPSRSTRSTFTVERITLQQLSLSMHTTHDEAERCFRADDSLHSVALLQDGHPMGLLNRDKFMDRYAKPYFKEVYGRQPCLLFANTTPLVLDKHTGIDELTGVLTSEDQRYLTDGFIVTEGGLYLGIGTGESLVRSVTEVRIEAARHANPLTFLPGNIPISEHIGRLLASGRDFVACYGDLNHFKPFNDHYGYWRGDEVIRLAASTFIACCDARRDFVGHVGGDDFVVLFQSEDWHQRCERIVKEFNERVKTFYDPVALARGGIDSEDREGMPRFFPLTTLSIGALCVVPGQFSEPDRVASAAAQAKLRAKQTGWDVYVQGAALAPA
ncbi:MAG: GGDEF domain-containing protein [Aquabacterium sp.]|jgi:diguanylate cyclase (GGDEF)-like protein|uniref:GGDEF domain-containing protein n=1 Tax=Aquabacterium sp. TaxID=1872578 RepID=UPI003BAE3010